MSEVQAVHDGALLVYDGVIRESGSARRIENLAQSRTAIEIDAGGRVVMPAFVEPDAVLITTGDELPRRNQADHAIATTSKRRLESHAVRSVEEWVRHGILAVGASTLPAMNLRDARKLLNIHKTLQAKPVRIRSVFAPHPSEWLNSPMERVVRSWAAAIVDKRLAGLTELDIPSSPGGYCSLEQLERLGRLAVSEGFILRLRTKELLSPEAQRTVARMGAISVTGPGMKPGTEAELARASCVWVLTGANILASQCTGESTRRLLDAGLPVALGSGYCGSGPGSYNPQFLLHLACRHLGMTIEEAITALTWNAACSLRMATVAGSLEPGKQADLVMIDAGDYRELPDRPGHNDIYMVLRGGRPIYRRSGLLAF
jgi:imidazolonepropionase